MVSRWSSRARIRIALLAVVLLQPVWSAVAEPAHAADSFSLSLLADLNPGTDNSEPGQGPVRAGTNYFFTATSDVAHSLYVTDGIAGGRTSEIFAFAEAFWDSVLVPIPGTNSILFMARDGNDCGDRVFVSDGTPEGTGPLKLSPTDSDTSGFYDVLDLRATTDKGVVFQGRYRKDPDQSCMSSDTSSYRYTDILPWRATNGTTVTDLKNGWEYPVQCWGGGSEELSCEQGTMLEALMVAGNVVYADLTDCEYGSDCIPYIELYKLDLGLSSPTWTLVKDLSPGWEYTSDFRHVAAIGSQLYFNASAWPADEGNRSLYTTNGTTAGTKRMYQGNFNDSGWLTADGYVYRNMATPVGPKLYFHPGGSEGQLWVADPTKSAATKVAECGYGGSIVALSTTAYFSCSQQLGAMGFGSDVLYRYTGSGAPQQVYPPEAGVGLFPTTPVALYSTIYFLGAGFPQISGSESIPMYQDLVWGLYSFTPGVDTLPILRVVDAQRPRVAGSKLFVWAFSDETGYEPHVVAPAAPPVNLSVTKAGTGSGTVTSDPAGINCSSGTCTAPFGTGTTVTLTATPSTGAVFTQWSGTGGCSGTSPTCTLTMTAAKSVTATFAPAFQLSVTKAGAGSGTVTSNPSGINCGATCSKYFPSGNVVLTAAADSGSRFTGWSGGCTGTTSTCSVSMTAAKAVTATFALVYNLSVTKAGTGTGTVTSTPSGISCGATCTAAYVAATSVTLSAAAATGSTFAGWSGACSGTGTCTVAMSSAKSVTATFNIQTFAVTVTKTGNGSGTVTSTPSGISCPATCSYAFNYGTSVTLTRSASTGSVFTAWAVGCTGTGSCVLTMTAAKAVTATFTLQKFALTAVKAGNGSGTVTSSPSGISCGTVCLFSYDYNTNVTLTATPLTGSTFTGWSGACSGTGTCTVSMTQVRTATATFTLNTYSVTVTKAGAGAGTVTSSPSGITCGATCTASFNHGATVTLTGAATSPSTFAGWSGACTGVTTTCVVSMTGAKSVTATFNPPLYAVTVTKTGPGNVTSSPTGVNCGTTCSFSWFSGTAVTLTATPSTGGSFITWAGGASSCGTSTTCAFTLSGAKAATATFGYNLALTKTPAAGGTVTSSLSGINCGTSCSSQTAVYASGTVTLTAVAQTGYSFAGWTGACTGTSTCALTMTAAKAVTATFKPILTLTKNVAAGASIVSAPVGISCLTTAATCTSGFTAGTLVTLTATTVAPYTAVTWSGCTPVDGFPKKCTVTVGGPTSVSATLS